MIAAGPASFAVYRDDAQRHLEHLAAHPRAAGSDAERVARDYCRAALEASGFAVTEERFEYSAVPGRYATPLAGGYTMVVMLVAASLGYVGRADAALAVLLGSTVLLGITASWIAVRGVLDLGLARSTAVNLVATRGTPRLWLMAHVDTKSQPVSMAARVSGVVGSILVAIAAIVLAAVGTQWQLPDDWRSVGWPIVGFAGVVAALPVAASLIGDRSPGAFDNASGVATVLLAASALPAATPLGVVITSAEELGMAGARAWVRGRTAGVAINVDGVDDAGMLTAMLTRRGSARLSGVFTRAASATGVSHRAISLVPGILVDAVALSDAGWESITVSHGSLRSIARIHTEGDNLSQLTGEGVVRASTVIVLMAGELA